MSEYRILVNTPAGSIDLDDLFPDLRELNAWLATWDPFGDARRSAMRTTYRAKTKNRRRKS